jgi:hypothetical protein
MAQNVSFFILRMRFVVPRQALGGMMAPFPVLCGEPSDSMISAFLHHD